MADAETTQPSRGPLPVPALWLPTVERIAEVMANAIEPGSWGNYLTQPGGDVETAAYRAGVCSRYRAQAAAALDEIAREVPSHVRRLMDSNALHMQQRDDARAELARLRAELAAIDDDVRAERTADAASGQDGAE